MIQSSNDAEQLYISVTESVLPSENAMRELKNSIGEFESLENRTTILRARQHLKEKKINKLRRDFESTYDEGFDKKFKRKIKERDGYKCLLCGKEDKLCIHHITYNKRITNMDECVALCCGCNSRVNKKDQRGYWQEYFKRLIHYKLNRK